MDANPNRTIPKSDPTFIPVHNLVTVIVPVTNGDDQEIAHEIKTVLADVLHMAPDTEGSWSVSTSGSKIFLHTFATRAASLLAFRRAIQNVADRHNLQIGYTYGPLGGVVADGAIPMGCGR